MQVLVLSTLHNYTLLCLEVGYNGTYYQFTSKILHSSLSGHRIPGEHLIESTELQVQGTLSGSLEEQKDLVCVSLN